MQQRASLREVNGLPGTADRLEIDRSQMSGPQNRRRSLLG